MKHILLTLFVLAVGTLFTAQAKEKPKFEFKLLPIDRSPISSPEDCGPDCPMCNKVFCRVIFIGKCPHGVSSPRLCEKCHQRAGEAFARQAKADAEPKVKTPVPDKAPPIKGDGTGTSASVVETPKSGVGTERAAPPTKDWVGWGSKALEKGKSDSKTKKP